jgi:hypothetical protein
MPPASEEAPPTTLGEAPKPNQKSELLKYIKAAGSANSKTETTKAEPPVTKQKFQNSYSKQQSQYSRSSMRYQN